MRTVKKIILICLSIFCLVGVDYYTKKIAVNELQGKSTLSYLHGGLKLSFVENSGGMLGLGDQLSKYMRFLVFGVLVAIVLAILFFYIIIKKGNSLLSIVALVLILSGGIGNLLDRAINHGKVIDFIILSIFNFHTGIFNIADFYVTTGVIILVISEIFKEKKSPVSKDNI